MRALNGNHSQQHELIDTREPQFIRSREKRWHGDRWLYVLQVEGGEGYHTRRTTNRIPCNLIGEEGSRCQFAEAFRDFARTT